MGKKKAQHKQTHQLMDAVNGPVVLVTESLHAFKAGNIATHNIKPDLITIRPYHTVFSFGNRA